LTTLSRTSPKVVNATIFAANARHSIFDYRRALTPNGILVMAGGGFPQIFQVFVLGPLLSWTGGRKFASFLAKINTSDLLFLKDLAETGKIVPVIDRQYQLSEVPEAIRYVGEGHARGKVVIQIADCGVTPPAFD